MRNLLRVSATLGLFPLLALADDSAAIKTTFIAPWMKAVQAKDLTAVKRMIHPKVQACMNEQSQEYFDNILASEIRANGKLPYKIVQVLPLLSPPPEWLPPDQFAYPVQPTYQVEVELGDTALVRFLAPANGSWYEVFPCPTEKGIAVIHERAAKAKEQRQHVEQLTSELKDPLLSELKALVDQKRIIDAVKRYREATGTDLTTARMVIEAVQTAQAR